MSNRRLSASAIPAWQASPHRSTPAPTLRRSALTRVLHGSILLAVIYQLVGSLALSRPLPGEDPQPNMLVHEYLGMAALGLVLAFWIWTLVRRGETRLGRLVPWFSPRRIAAVVDDTATQLDNVLHGRVSHEADGAMASAIHGLGLLVLTGMAVSGTAFFFAHGHTAHLLLIGHKLLANLMWAYLIGHAAMAVLHHLLGSDIFSRMFWRARTVTSRPQLRSLPPVR